MTLRDLLRHHGGTLTFREFMAAALYDPASGYYTTQIRTVGRGGDFSTSATLSPLLGRAVAAWIREEKSAALWCGVWHVIECGPGDGSLQLAVLRALGWRGRRGLRAHLVERSPVLRRQQQRKLWRHRHRISWHESPASALTAAGGRALLFSNELVDAFPATLLQKDGETWHEVALECQDGGRIAEVLRPEPVVPPASLPVAGYPDGQRIEDHASWREWFDGWRPQWKSGAMLTIDYGDAAAALYHRRPGGTVRGFRGQQRVEGPALYQDPGSLDLTADVNFTALAAHGEMSGLTTVSVESQAAFLRRQLPEDGWDRLPVNAWLADDAGPGGAFQCLVQRAKENAAGN